MRILIVGSGAREHAITKSLSRSKTKPRLFCFGSSHNPGIQALAVGYCVGSITDVRLVCEQAQIWGIDWAIVGPEAPLEQGLADALWGIGIKTIGPKKALAQIETSKGFTRDLMQKYQIQGLPRYKIFSSQDGLLDFLETLGVNQYVVKANGLMAGKGVKVAGEHIHSFEEALAYCQEIFDGHQTVVIEEKLFGQEFSFMSFSDGHSLAPMPIVQDNKRAFEGDTGPNTGGMGSYSDSNHRLPFLTKEDVDSAWDIHQRVIHSLMKEVQDRYVGILYGGFIATAKGVYVIEFNARFGDPEALNVLSLLESDFVAHCLAMLEGRLLHEDVIFANQATVCKYAVPDGYPDNPVRNVEIDVQGVHNKENLFLAAVNASEGRLYATGSRTAAFVGVADSLASAEILAEEEIRRVQGPLFHRRDIGSEAMLEKRIESMRKLRAV